MSSNRPPRAPPTPSPTPGPQGSSKLPKFLQKTTRDRSKSVVEPIMQASSSTSMSADGSIASSSSSSIGSPSLDSYSTSSRHRGDRRISKLKGTLKELKDDRIAKLNSTESSNDDGTEDTPIIIEPSSSVSRSRTRSERPLSASSSDSHPAVNYYPAHSSSQRLSDMGTRLSGWFSHTFNTSSNDLSLPALIASTSPGATSPTRSRTPGLGLLTAARHGKGHLDKAVRYLLDSDAVPDKCSDPIWLLGVQHPGYEPPPPPSSSSPPASGRRSSLDMRRSSSIRNSVSSLRGATSSPEPSMQQRNPGAHWPPVFYSDFTSRIWCTYRSHYTPIRDQSLAHLEAEANGQPLPLASASPRKWTLLGGGEKGWTTDSGWGCMLRTGQSLLANALIHLHLGRDWRRPPHPVYTADYATYVKILTWFFDSPDPQCPFSVHRMALAGKDLGKDVGQWFGPSTAAGAIKTLVHAFGEAGLGVSVATDGVVYETDVLAASNAGPYMYRRHSRMTSSSPSTRRRRSAQPQNMLSPWGQRPVLVLVGIRLGIDCVNPVYYDALKTLYTFPQSVGISGGRPSSSYYFVGVQADNLFYLDPHHTRPTIPFRSPPSRGSHNLSPFSSPPDSPPSSFRDIHTIPPSPRHVKASSSISSYASQISPTPSQASVSGQSLFGGLDADQEHYITAYNPMELKTFHCDKVRKMPISSLDPSMLIGFLCRDERDWKDLRERISEMSKKYKAIFAIQDEPPSWPSDSDEMGMESVSDVEIDIDGPDDAFSLSPEPESKPEQDGEVDLLGDEKVELRNNKREENRSRQSEDATTEEDAADPLTPGPSSMSHTQAFEQGNHKEMEEDLLGDDEEWIDPSLPTPQPREAPNFPVLPLSTANSTATTASYVSASSSYSSMQDFPSGSAGRNGNGYREHTTDSDRDRRVHRRESSRAKNRSGRSSSRREVSSAQEYVPFPVVDDREPEDTDFQELSSQSGFSSPDGHVHLRSSSSASRTPIASVVTQASRFDHNNGAGSRIRNVFARDGGRTQSGGVRGIVDDINDF